jgi:hypothetical protein
LNGRAVPVLRVLDQKHHQEGNDRGAGVDDCPSSGILGPSAV